MSVCVPTFRDVECKYTEMVPRIIKDKVTKTVTERRVREVDDVRQVCRTVHAVHRRVRRRCTKWSASRRRCRAKATSSIACRWSVWSKRTASNATASRRPPSARCATCTVRIARSTCVVRCRPEEPRPHRVRLRSGESDPQGHLLRDGALPGNHPRAGVPAGELRFGLATAASSADSSAAAAAANQRRKQRLAVSRSRVPSTIQGTRER